MNREGILRRIGADADAGLPLLSTLPERFSFTLGGVPCAIAMLSDGEHPWSHALYRSMETMVGIGAAVLISLVPGLKSTGNDRSE